MTQGCAISSNSSRKWLVCNRANGGRPKGIILCQAFLLKVFIENFCYFFYTLLTKERRYLMIISNRTRTNPIYNKVYFTWHNMMKRCYNADSKDYQYYGAKGISVCEEWKIFKNFESDEIGRAHV